MLNRYSYDDDDRYIWDIPEDDQPTQQPTSVS